MKRWLITLAQFLLGLWLLWQALFYGGWFVLVVFHAFKGDIGPLSLDLAGVTIFSFLIDAALILCFGAGVAFFRDAIWGGGRLSVAAAVCYWLFIAVGFIYSWATAYPTERVTDFVPVSFWLTGTAIALLAYGAQSYAKSLPQNTAEIDFKLLAEAMRREETPRENDRR